MPPVFVSYSHDSEEHIQWVGKLTSDLAARLVESPISIVLDQTHLKAGMDIARFMERGITEADHVLVICTPAYNKKADDGHGGAGYEKMIITSELIADQDTKKFIPIVRNVTEQRRTPICLATRLYVDLSDGENYESALSEICEVFGHINVPNQETVPKGWSFDKEGKDQLIKGEKRVVIHQDGRKETYLLIDNDIVCLEQEFPWGVKAYYELDKNGNILKQKFPYPISEYCVEINPDSTLSHRQTPNLDGYIEHAAEIKWGRTVRWLTKADGELLDYHIKGGCQIDHRSKEIRCGW